MKKAVIYARYSSDKQTEQSIEGQVLVCKEFADKNGIVIIGEYVDRAMTGTNDNRPEFQRMIADSKKGEFEVILVYKLDRFSRDKCESVIYKKQLKDIGVKVQSATEMISDTPEGILLESIIEGYNQFYSVELAQKIRRGNRMNCEKGLWTGGSLLFGYKVIDKKIHIDEEKAEIVRKFFKDYANGVTKKQIVNELNSKGIRTLRGYQFTTNSFWSCLSNKRYLGIVEHTNGEIYTNIYPQIIDQETFNRVQIMLGNRKKKPAMAKAKVDYVLTARVFCGLDGSTMSGVSGTSRTAGKKCYYACNQRYKYKKCDKKHERKDDLENEVVRHTRAYILHPKNQEAIIDKLMALQEKSLTDDKIKDYESRIAKIDREIVKLVDVIMRAEGEDLIKQINQKSKDLSIQKKDLEYELARIKLINKVLKTRDDYRKLINKFIQLDTDKHEERKLLINGLVNSVWVFEQGIICFYNSENTRPITLDELKQVLKERGIDYDQIKDGSYFKRCGDPTWTRTMDTLVKSQMLYQLSYGVVSEASEPTSTEGRYGVVKWPPTNEVCYGVVTTHQHEMVIWGLERVMRIELTHPAWKAGVLPLNYTRSQSTTI